MSSTSRREAARSAVVLSLSLLVAAIASLAPAPASAAPATGHPRLWIRADDLPRLRAWATSGNPLWSQGVARAAADARLDIDAGRVPGPDADSGAPGWVEYPAESYAELCAFMSLVGPEADRADWAQRARTLLMYVVEKALPGAAPGQPYRDPDFSVRDRSRWHGEGFGLTVDWIYPYLSADDKAKIRTVFLRWAGELASAAITGHDHPEPMGVVNDPSLVDSPAKTRWAVNNYFTAHMRNLGLMAMAFDPADDPGGALTGQLGSVTGAWLYVLDRALRTDARGGLVPEGFEYGPQTLGFAAQLLLALETAGQDDASAWGPQAKWDGNPFWDELVSAFLHSLSPVAATAPSDGLAVYQPAWYGDGQSFRAPDFIEVFGPLGVHDVNAGHAARLAALRWIETNAPPGGADALLDRVGRPGGSFQVPILAFLLFEPGLAAPADPRPSLPLTHFAPGLGRLLALTDWGPSASLFSYKLSYNLVDHQYGDGNQIELWRKGEWLTRERTGWDLEYGAPRNHNTLALENGRPEHDTPCEYREVNWRTGAQWAYVSAGDPTLVSWVSGPEHVAVTGDATNLYNSASEGATDVLHASRSVVWLPPDLLVVYDRAATRTAGRFKQFRLAFTGPASIAGARTSATTPAGQQLFVTTLLPAGAALSIEPASILTCGGSPAGATSAAIDDPVRTFLSVEAPGGPASARFLHVLEGADAGASPSAVVLLASSAGTPFSGAAVRGTAVLFPVDVGGTVASVTYTVPAGVALHKLSGLDPTGTWSVASAPSPDGGTTVTVSAGGDLRADAGGVLTFRTRGAGPRLDSVAPARGPLAGGTAVTLRGDGFAQGASVTFGGLPASSVNVASATEIRAATPPGAAPGPVAVAVRNPDGSAASLAAGFAYESAPDRTVLLVPVLLALDGLGGSSYSTELTFTNRGATEARLAVTYTANAGGGSGTASVTLPPGRQLLVPDAIGWLSSLGLAVPSSGTRLGTLRVEAAGLSDPSDLGVVARTTAAVPEGRAGLAYAAVREMELAGSGALILAGLRQNGSDRSNVALVHAGATGSGEIRLRATLVSGDPAQPMTVPLAEVTLGPGGFHQWTEILAGASPPLANAFVRVERTAGSAPWTAYAVINDQGTNDGSFVPAVPEAILASSSRQVAPAVVSAGAYTTELVLTNLASDARTVRCRWVADGLATSDRTVRFERRLAPNEQWIQPDVVGFLRAQGLAGVGAGSLAGALFVDVAEGGGVLAGARTSSPGGSGRYGVYYAAVREEAFARSSAALDLLRQDATNRTNLAIVDAGLPGSPDGTYAIDIVDGATGNAVKTVGPLTVPAGGWRQVDTILRAEAPGTSIGHARVRRTSGPGPFLAYTVVNDGAAPGERSGDGAYVPMRSLP